MYTPTEEKLIKARIQLQRHHPFFARLAMNLNWHEEESIDTAGVDPRGNMYYNASFIDKLNIDQVKGLLVHEIMHVALGHLLRKDERDAMLFNISADIIINEMLVSEDFVLPDGLLLVSSLPNKISKKIDLNTETSESLYDKLLQYSDELQSKKNFDEHLSDGYGNGKKEISNVEKEALRKEWEKKLIETAQHVKMSRGHVPGHIERLVEALQNPQLNWYSMLYKYITQELPIDQTYRRPGRRSYATGFYMPSTLRENLEISVTIDLSGSIGKKDYEMFLSELYGILNSFSQVNATILYWDTQVRGMLKVNSSNKQKAIDNVVQAGGGTAFNCLLPYMKEQRVTSRLNIHFTDGYIESNINLPQGVNLFVLTTDSVDLKAFKELHKINTVSKLTKN
jgi:predicted metal-dependent peptidase